MLLINNLLMLQSSIRHRHNESPCKAHASQVDFGKEMLRLSHACVQHTRLVGSCDSRHQIGPTAARLCPSGRHASPSRWLLQVQGHKCSPACTSLPSGNAYLCHASAKAQMLHVCRLRCMTCCLGPDVAGMCCCRNLSAEIKGTVCASVTSRCA